MNEHLGTQPRDDAQTTGTATRPGRDLRPPYVADLLAEASSLFDEPVWAERDRNTRTIVTTERMRVALTALRAGAEIGSEGNDDTVAVQVLRGRVTLELDGSAPDVRAGSLAAMAEPGPWRLGASEDSLLLVTVALGTPS